MSVIKSFDTLGLAPNLLSAISSLGYEAPTPIQEESIPVLLAGGDLLAQAQTGTGKTAAFALPILCQIDIAKKKPQALVIAPTRELAIQLAEAFKSMAKDMQGFHVLPIYGGQDYQIQLRALKRGAHVIVGTPGRVMDHLRRGTLTIKGLDTVVIDEADEMLKMGFVDDIEWILEQIPHKHQTALFSATMPVPIKKITQRYLHDPKKIHIKPTKTTVDSIEQFYTRVYKEQKMDVLTRFLEVEDITAAIIFTRTKNASAEVAEKLQARGYAASALNGDMNQSLRKKVIDRIKAGSLDLIVATDVAARGIDVERLSHVINYDIPYDTESYIHRIGRTGRAGRKGKALLFVTPRERRLLKDIEHAIRKPIKEIEPPSLDEMKQKRSKQFAEKVIKVLEKSKRLGPYYEMVDNIIEQIDCEANDVAAALAYLSQQANPLSLDKIEKPKQERRPERRPERKTERRRSSTSRSSDATKRNSSAYSKDKPKYDTKPKKRPKSKDSETKRKVRKSKDAPKKKKSKRRSD